jgi:hypothetical protein
MSLIATAAPWNAGETSNKRVSTLRKTIKKTTGISDVVPEYKSNDTNSLNGSLYNRESEDHPPADIEHPPIPPARETPFQFHAPNDGRSEKVMNLIENLNTDNDGSHLANFNPPAYPSNAGMGKPVQPAASNMYLSINGLTGNTGMPASDAKIPALPNEFQLSSPDAQFKTSGESRFYPRNANADFSNYRQTYLSPNLTTGSQSYLQGLKGNEAAAVSAKLMDKINYMIHMLEQQQNEKTDNMMEEFILYTLLGVFIIFVVDAFARSGNGKYVR